VAGRFLVRGASKKQRDYLIQEATELTKIFGSIVAKSK